MLQDVIKLSDYPGAVPGGIDDAFRRELMDTCLAVAGLRADGINEDAREATFVITDPSIDSYNEVLDAGLFDESIEDYMRLATFLPDHQRVLFGVEHTAQIGHCRRIFKDGEKLLGTFWFSPRAPGDDRWRALLEGSLRAVSVGFRPQESKRDEDGILHYTKAILREVSTVAIPANSNAMLVNQYMAGIFGKQSERSADSARITETEAAVKQLQQSVENLKAENTVLSRRSETNDKTRSASVSDRVAAHVDSVFG